MRFLNIEVLIFKQSYEAKRQRRVLLLKANKLISLLIKRTDKGAHRTGCWAGISNKNHCPEEGVDTSGRLLLRFSRRWIGSADFRKGRLAAFNASSIAQPVENVSKTAAAEQAGFIRLLFTAIKCLHECLVFWPGF